MELFDDVSGREAAKEAKAKQAPRKRANELTGRDWTRFSVSVWNDIRKTADEARLGHPAMFPQMLVDRCVKCFTTHEDRVILDPFMGSGSVPLAARRLGRHGVGFEISPEYIDLAKRRLSEGELFGEGSYAIHPTDCRKALETLGAESVDFCITSPPYWDILSQKRTADYKEIRDYGETEDDLAKIHDYECFLDALQEVFEAVFAVLKPGKYCLVNVMDLRKKDKFFPLHSDLAKRMEAVGYKWDDVIIWDRRQEYNNLRTLGYPSVFRLNKIHEYVMIFQKPRA